MVSVRWLLVVSVLVLGWTLSGPWVSLFDGSTLDGWSLKAVHGGQGGIWTVEEGAIVGNQATDHTGGLLGTDGAYGDFEVEATFRADDPVDSGLFLRTRPDGMGYQVTIDYREGGTVGSIYAPSEGGFLVEYADWRELFKPDDWNQLRARIQGQPPVLEVWLNGHQTISYRDTTARYPEEGYLGLQVHGGESSWGMDSRIRFREIRVRSLD